MIPFEKVNYRREPYPHFVCPDFFAANDFAELDSQWPTAKEFEEILGREHHGRVDFEKDMPAFDRFLQRAPAWKKFYDQVNSAEFVGNMLAAIGHDFLRENSYIDPDNWSFVDFSDFKLNQTALPGMAGKLARRMVKVSRLDRMAVNMRHMVKSQDNQACELYPVFNMGETRDGYLVRPHTDNRHKLCALLVYLDDLPEGVGDLNIHKLKDPKPHQECRRYPANDELEVVGKAPTRKNLSVSFVNCNHAYHSVEPWTSNTRRRIVYVGVAARGFDSVWKTDHATPKYEPSPETVVEWQAKSSLHRLIKPIH